MDILTDIVTVGAISSVGLLMLAKLLPNEKVYAMGFKFGTILNSLAMLRLGDSWTKIESFLINSGGQFFTGVKDGLLSDNDPTIEEPEYEEKNKNIRM
jgi:hypothetical protein